MSMSGPGRRVGAIDIMDDSLRGLRSDHNALIGRFTLDDANTVIGLADWQQRTGQDRASVVATAEELFTYHSRTMLVITHVRTSCDSRLMFDALAPREESAESGVDLDSEKVLD